MTTKEFIQYASERPELCEKMSDCATPEECYAIAKGEGLTDDFDTFAAIMTATSKEMQALSGKDLESVQAAGQTTDMTLSASLGFTAASVIATASASAAI